MSRSIIIATFVLMAMTAIAFEVVARTGRTRVPTLDAVFAGARRSALGRAITFVVWFWFGWHFLARGN